MNKITKSEYESYDYRATLAEQAIAVAIEMQRQSTFLPEYRWKQSDAQVLGMIVSHRLDYAGNLIAEAFIEALTDANFHTEAAEIRKLFKLEEA